LFKKFIPFCSLSIFCLLTSCATTKPLETQVLKTQVNSLTTIPAIARINMVKSPSDSICSCITPVPDALYNVNDGFSLGLTSKLGKEQAGLSESETEVGLGGRSPNVLITREMYFRLCEFLSNGTYSKETKVELFKATLEAITLVNKNNLSIKIANQTSDSDIKTGKSKSETGKNKTNNNKQKVRDQDKDIF
jgi:hypothetical protein